MTTIHEALREGLDHHRAGRLKQAEHAYRKVLLIHPRHSGAVHLLGLIAFQAGKHELALNYVQEAINLDRFRAQYPADLGEIYRALGRIPEAIASYHKALELDPEAPRARNYLGTLYQATGETEAAIESFRDAIEISPDFAEAHRHLGEVLATQGQLEEAQAALERSVKLDPNQAESYHSLGKFLYGQGKVLDAIACYQKAVRLRPELADAHYDLAIAQFKHGQANAALRSCSEAVRLAPEDLERLRNYGVLLQGQGQLDEALACFQKAIQTDANSAESYFGEGTIYQSLNMLDEAIASYEEAVRLKPDYFQACNNLSALYGQIMKPDKAIEYCKKGLEHAPRFGKLYGNMAIALLAQGRSEEAIDAARQAVELSGGAPEHSNYVYALNFSAERDAGQIFAEHLAWAKKHAEPLTVGAAPHANDRGPERRLRVGYVSPYFREHAVNNFVEPVLRSHNHDKFEVFCYNDLAAPDPVTARIKQHAHHWRDVAWTSNEELADLVRADAIDILVDVCGHIGDNRLLAFARKPAPVQVTYLGYQNTTGMTAMDYRVTDEQADPPGVTDRYYSERLARLPRAFFCFQPHESAPATTAPPAAANGYITFGSFNNFAKANPRVVDTWLEIVARVPQSRLMVLAYTGGYLEGHLKGLAQKRGIEAKRIELYDPRPRVDYLELVSRADVALDPFPFNGHTSTCDALWQGVPVVMMRGATYASRFGASALVNVGLESLIAQSVEQYVEKAVNLAGDTERLRTLRHDLRRAMRDSPLLDHAAFTRNLEDAYRQMWRTWCKGPAATA